MEDHWNNKFNTEERTSEKQIWKRKKNGVVLFAFIDKKRKLVQVRVKIGNYEFLKITISLIYLCSFILFFNNFDKMK